FLLAKQKKVGAPPGAHPGQQRILKHYVFNSCLRPPRLDKAPISFQKPTQGPSSTRPNPRRFHWTRRRDAWGTVAQGFDRFGPNGKC
ncbi:hypothetical protein, partial [Ottowia sp.]|uniref:hypothetical protein n=1 Tax=Ottowia sp. TaxID=1898956 RepID=UPI00261F6A13